MTRNRDDFSAGQALYTAALGFAAIALVMVTLGTVMAGQKEAALDRAANVAASTIQFQAAPADIAALDRSDARG